LAVIPVRETCAQTLAVVLEHAPAALCLKVMQRGLLPMIAFKGEHLKWAVKHSALVGVKYWMAVRQDLLSHVLQPVPGVASTPVFDAIVQGLKDHNDEVRAVASSSLLPISDLLVELLPEKVIFEGIVLGLWDCLTELDDLTSATSSVMDLLSNLIRKPRVSAVLVLEAQGFLDRLVPHLFPFFRHAITSVRLAVLRTLASLTNLPVPCSWITVDLLRLVFQNFVLEERKDVQAATLELWTSLIPSLASAGIVDDLVSPTLEILVALCAAPIGLPLDQRLFISYQSASSQKKRT
ncbi:btaf1 RNA polymerase II, B-TFIID transcription factor-associated, 170kDa, partial [Kappamyces sp. JEL0680]